VRDIVCQENLLVVSDIWRLLNICLPSEVHDRNLCIGLPLIESSVKMLELIVPGHILNELGIYVRNPKTTASCVLRHDHNTRTTHHPNHSFDISKKHINIINPLHIIPRPIPHTLTGHHHLCISPPITKRGNANSITRG
jgi:hypothetical protein